MLIPDELRDRAERFPDRVAVDIVDGPSFTYAEWDRRSNAVARGLVDAGLARGERVALFLENEYALHFQTGYFAAHKAGGVSVPINPRYAEREVTHILDNSGARFLVTAGEQVGRARALARQVAVPPTLVVPAADAGPGELAWETLLGGDESPFQVEVSADDLADILYTSGTTGLPKGVASTHQNATFHGLRPIRKGGRFLHSIPLSTFFGSHGTQLFALRLGLTNVVLPRFDAHRFAQLIAERRPSWVVMVPSHVMLLLESGALEGVDTSSVSTILYASAPMPAGGVRGLAEVFPDALQLNGYGLTEGGGSACMMPPGEALKRPGSVGQPMPGITVRIVDERGDEVATGEIGEVTLKIPTGERYYFGDPDATAATWRDGWVHSGDLGYVDADGYLYLADRKKDMIIRGGYNIYCIEVEDALYELPEVAEAAVVGVPHGVLGEDVCAVVRLRDGAAAPSLDDVRARLGSRLADYKLPRQLVLRDAPLPRSGMGKVDKKALRAEMASSTPRT
ncbi:MAG TPA: class I adenylate-forming enzyme family protein [Acidimicrobiales bacterium]|nr:class I adenylate-forming enzyme family protein [Acidimicrobiales bacterium]